ncbi:hypothetical protein ES702_07364 [subsurface metagenome]
MPVEIEYEKRSIFRNVFDPGAWQNLLGGVGDIVGEAATTWENIERLKGTKPLEEPPPYDPKLTLGDFRITPNWSLILLGGGLLVLALILRKRK